MLIKTFIQYSDWLMLTRGSIDPKIGDKIITNSAAKYNSELQSNIVTKVRKEDRVYKSIYNFYVDYRNTCRSIEGCLVEVEVETSDLKL